MSQIGNNEEPTVISKNSLTSSPAVQTYSLDKLANSAQGESTITINLFAGPLHKADKPVQTDNSVTTVSEQQESEEVTAEPRSSNTCTKSDNFDDELSPSNRKSWNSASRIFENDKLMDLRKNLDVKNTGSTRTTSDLERRKLEAELKAAEEIAKIKQSVIEKRLALELAALQEGVDYQKVKPTHCESPCKKKLSSNFSSLLQNVIKIQLRSTPKKVLNSEFKAFEDLAEKKTSLIDTQLAQELLKLEYQSKAQHQHKQQHLMQQSKYQQQPQLQQQPQQQQYMQQQPQQQQQYMQQQHVQQQQMQQQQQQQMQLSRQMQISQPHDVPSNHSRKAWQRLTGKGGAFNLSRRDSSDSHDTGSYMDSMKSRMYKNDSEMNNLNAYNNMNMMPAEHKHTSHRNKMNLMNTNQYSQGGRNSNSNMYGSPEQKYMASQPPTNINYVKQMNGRNNYYQQQQGMVQPQMEYEQNEGYVENLSIWKSMYAKVKRKFKSNRSQGGYQ